ncbi:MAG: hypothetical protein RIQ52_880 [Pseudomonadota bacterium]|jgi:molybdopterin synthase catalytic subunit
MVVELCPLPFDPWQAIGKHASNGNHHAQSVSNGASAVFVGTMRDHNEGDGVVSLFLEHYPGMTEKELCRIVREAEQQWALSDVLLLHRTGQIMPGEAIVLVAVWSAHRLESFEACRQIMEALKQHAPFWKYETLMDGSKRWVSHNTPGFAAQGLGAASDIDQ